MKKKSVNYLDLVPEINSRLKWEEKQDGTVVIIRENKGLTSRMASFLFGAPKETKVSLDEYGNFVWKLIDGKNSVYNIAIALREQYGEKAEPLYDRICQYFKALQANNFIEMN